MFSLTSSGKWHDVYTNELGDICLRVVTSPRQSSRFAGCNKETYSRFMSSTSTGSKYVEVINTRGDSALVPATLVPLNFAEDKGQYWLLDPVSLKEAYRRVESRSRWTDDRSRLEAIGLTSGKGNHNPTLSTLLEASKKSPGVTLSIRNGQFMLA
jgi:hypothetical protein